MQEETERPLSESHPLVLHGSWRDWSRRKIADEFHIDYSVFRRIVTGHLKVSYSRAKGWERQTSRSTVKISASDVMDWQDEHSKRAT